MSNEPGTSSSVPSTQVVAYSYLSDLEIKRRYKSLQAGFQWNEIPLFSVIIG